MSEVAMSSTTGDSGASSSESALSVEGVSLAFRGVRALEDISLNVAPGSVCGLIGPNGAGKTTLFNCITRLYTPDAGSIVFEGRSLLDKHAHQVLGAGISRTFQNLGLFHGQTVLENVLVAGHSAQGASITSGIFRLPGARRLEKQNLARAEELLEEVDLTRHRDTRIEDLPFGTQKRVELARALAARPRLLLLDEPANGLAHGEVDELRELVLSVKAKHDLTVVLVEHHMKFVMAICDRVVALNSGLKIFDGTPAEAQHSKELAEAYLGSKK
jgi:branched-chain amino acid transport system ATP-binding protein